VSLFYIENVDVDLLIYAINNSNEHFLTYSLSHSIIDTKYLTDPSVIKQILEILSRGTHTLVILNVLIFSDISRWQ
jgi:hypothetical protein